MSERISDNDILKEIRDGNVATPEAKGSCGTNSKNEDGSVIEGKSLNTRKNTVISNAAVVPVISKMEDEDASTTTIAIGKNTYTIGEPGFKPKLPFRIILFTQFTTFQQ